MFDKNKNLELYTREHYTFAESLYKEYVKMRRATYIFESHKYSKLEDTFIDSKEGKEGFLAGVYVMLSLIGDL